MWLPVEVGRHSSNACDVDLSKLKCFKCQKFGHISANCPERKKGKVTRCFHAALAVGDSVC